MLRLIAGLAMGAVLLAGGTAAAASKTAVKAEACSKYGQVESALTNLKQLTPQSTVGEFRSAERQFETSYGDFAGVAKKAAKPQTENLDKSIKQLSSTIHNLPAEATGEQAKAMIKGDIAKVQVARTQLLTALGCPPPGAAPAPTP